MKTCTEPKYRQLIHAYELGMLTEDQRRSFECHLLECEACFEEIRAFQETSRLLNRDTEVRDLAARIDAEESEKTVARFSLKSRIAWPLSLTAVAIVILLVLRPWNIEIHPTQEALAASNRVVVMNFSDPGAPEGNDSLAFVITNLMIADLAQGGIDVVSTMRLYEIARALGHSDPTQLDWGQAREVASRARANWILLGTVLSPPPHPSLSVELVDAKSGDVAGGFRIAAVEREGLYDVVDRLSEQVGVSLAPRTVSTPPGPSVAQVTSPSLDAYWFFLRGIDEYEKLHYDRAIASFQRALELDPEMPMAYYHLARLLDRSLITKAVENVNRATREEQFYIRALSQAYAGKPNEAIGELLECVKEFPDSREAWHLLARYTNGLGRTQEAIQYFERALALDSTSKMIYNELAYCYSAVGDSAGAILAANKYVEWAPEEANPYDTQGEILARFGHLHEAITAFERALEIDPGWYHSRAYLGYMYMFDGQYERANSVFAQLIFQSNPDLRNAARLYAVYPLLRKGKFHGAIAKLDTLIGTYDSTAIARAAGPINYMSRQLRAMCLEEMGRTSEAIAEMKACLTLPTGITRTDSTLAMGYLAKLLAEGGRLAEADSLIAERRKVTAGSAEQPDPTVRYISAMAALGSGDFDSAVHLLESVSLSRDDFLVYVDLAKAYLGAGRLPEAENLLRTLANSYTSPRAYGGIESVKLHYYLGLVLEKMNRTEEAVDQFRMFITIWEDAEPATTSLTDARRRLDRLLHTP